MEPNQEEESKGRKQSASNQFPYVSQSGNIRVHGLWSKEEREGGDKGDQEEEGESKVEINHFNRFLSGVLHKEFQNTQKIADIS